MPYAIITGASEGMGKAIAEKLLREGFSIAVCARNKHRLEAIEAEWNEKYPAASIIAYNADVSIREELHSFADTVISNFPEIDILVNNAGLFLTGNIADEPESHLEKMLSTNLWSAYRLTRKILPAMNTRGAHIFNISSIAGLQPNPGSGSYSISKYALVGFSANLREELKPRKIKVTAVCPGSTFNASWGETGIDPASILEAGDIASVVWSAYSLSAQANIDTIVIKPLNGIA